MFKPCLPSERKEQLALTSQLRVFGTTAMGDGQHTEPLATHTIPRRRQNQTRILTIETLVDPSPQLHSTASRSEDMLVDPEPVPLIDAKLLAGVDVHQVKVREPRVVLFKPPGQPSSAKFFLSTYGDSNPLQTDKSSITRCTSVLTVADSHTLGYRKVLSTRVSATEDLPPPTTVAETNSSANSDEIPV